MKAAALLCSVRDCHLPLTRDGARDVCPRKHSFDIARSGYINLLQPQERRSRQPGDTLAAIAGRRFVHDSGVTEPLLRGIAKVSGISSHDVVMDAGCGDGYYLGTLAGETGCNAHGVDISIPAVDAAARRYPACEWIVANADRFVPYADESFTLVLSITARRNPEEFHRVLTQDGRLLVAVPAPDDLIELRGAGQDRVARTVAEFAGTFALETQLRVSTHAELEPEAAQAVLHSIYRPVGAAVSRALRVTFSLDLLYFRAARIKNSV